jgi:hypothetical protein
MEAGYDMNYEPANNLDSSGHTLRSDKAHASVHSEEPQLFFQRFRPRRRDARSESRLSFDAVLGRHFWPASPEGR